MKAVLSSEAIQQALAGVAFVRRIVYRPVVSSTNDVARALAGENAPEGTLVMADEQTAGRGRRGRAWWAPPGTCLLLSLLVRPTLPPVQALRLTMAAGLAAAEAIEQVTSLPAQLKWPNDIWLRRKKAGGILTESALTGERMEYAIVGIGLNINVDVTGHPELEGQATSVQMELGRAVERLSILRALVERFAAWYADLASPRLPAAWAERLVMLRQWVDVQDGTRQIIGLAEAVDEEGALLVRTPDGARYRFPAGDVSLHAI